MDPELILKFIGYFPDYLSALSCELLRFFWTTFVDTAVYQKSVIKVAKMKQCCKGPFKRFQHLPNIRSTKVDVGQMLVERTIKMVSAPFHIFKNKGNVEFMMLNVV